MLLTSKVNRISIIHNYFNFSCSQNKNYTEIIDVSHISSLDELYQKQIEVAKEIILSDSLNNLNEDDLKFVCDKNVERFFVGFSPIIFSFELTGVEGISYIQKWQLAESEEKELVDDHIKDNMGFITEIETINIYPNYNEANRECDYFIECDKSKVESMQSFIEERLKKAKEYIESRLGAKLSGKEKASYHINNPVDYFYGDEFGYLIIRDPDHKFTYDECWKLGTRAVYTSPNRESKGYDIDVDLPK